MEEGMNGEADATTEEEATAEAEIAGETEDRPGIQQQRADGA